jgi:hypothetical protein
MNPYHLIARNIHLLDNLRLQNNGENPLWLFLGASSGYVLLRPILTTLAFDDCEIPTAYLPITSVTPAREYFLNKTHSALSAGVVLELGICKENPARHEVCEFAFNDGVVDLDSRPLSSSIGNFSAPSSYVKLKKTDIATCLSLDSRLK